MSLFNILLSAGWLLVEAVLVVLLVAVVDIWRRRYSEDISWPSLLKIWALQKIGALKTSHVYKQFEKDVRHFSQAQEKFLLDRIRRSENTAYGRVHGFSSIHSVDEFRRTQPVTEYANYEQYISRMADDGDKSALLGAEDDILAFALSSGTTGKHKRIPISAQCAANTQKHLLFGPFMYRLRRDVAPSGFRKLMNVTGGLVPRRTKAGVPILSVSGTTENKKIGVLQHLNTSPAIASDVKSEEESHYIHLLFGLRDKHLVSIVCVFINNFVGIMRRLQVHQKDLINDIRRGRIKEDLNIPPHVRAALNARLRPMPERAAEVERELACGVVGLVPRLWPEVSRISSIWSGNSFEIYYCEARQLIGPDLPVISFGYLASEGMIGANIEPRRRGQPRYTLVPDTNFYEFLPVHNGQVCDLEEVDPKQLLLPHQLQVGEEYEIFMTTASGFYRYRVGDVIKIVGFYHQAPQLEMLYRSGQSLNVNGEKLAEDVVFQALRACAAAHWPGLTLKDYTAAGSQFAPGHGGALDPHYLLFFEADGPQLSGDQLAKVDAKLIDMHEHYSNYRRLGKISPMRLHRVPAGTFARFKQHLLDTTSVNQVQFKMPRVLKSHDRVNWFLDASKTAGGIQQSNGVAK